MKHIPQTIITIPKGEAVCTPYLGTLDPYGNENLAMFFKATVDGSFSCRQSQLASRFSRDTAQQFPVPAEMLIKTNRLRQYMALIPGKAVQITKVDVDRYPKGPRTHV